MRVLEGHDSAVTCVQFDPDKIVSGSMDGTLRLWDMHTGMACEVEVGGGPPPTVCVVMCAGALITELFNVGEGGVVWRVRYSSTKIVTAVRGAGQGQKYVHRGERIA